MADLSSLDSKYFVDSTAYNCPYCNRRHIRFSLVAHDRLDWSDKKEAHAYFVKCHGCEKISLHLSYVQIHFSYQGRSLHFNQDLEDDHFFYHHPTSFFVLDSRIPRVLRDLVTEAEGSVKMNFLTGASACIRKAIYELVSLQKLDIGDYEERIKALSLKFPHVDRDLFEELAHITDMTSDKVHEESWEKWDSATVTLLLETLRAIFHDIYVVPAERGTRVQRVRDLKERLARGKAGSATSGDSGQAPGEELTE